MAITGTPNNRHRVEWIDFVKGIAITLVVYGHVMQGVFAGRPVTELGFFRASDAFIYSFHMPAFFIVSGLLSRSLWDVSLVKYIGEKARTIAWPYVVWFVLGTFSAVCFSKYYNHASTNPLMALTCLVWNPGSFWFLHAFFLVHVLAALLRKLPLSVLLLISIFGFWISRFCPNEAIHNVLYHFPFMVIGLFGSVHLIKIDSFFRRWGAICFIPLLLIQLAATILISNVSWPVKLWLGVSGTAGIASLASCVFSTILFPIFCRIGYASLGVFLMHPYFQGISRALLHHLPGMHAPILLVLLETLCGIIIPVVIYEKAMKTKWRLFFTFKRAELRKINMQNDAETALKTS